MNTAVLGRVHGQVYVHVCMCEYMKKKNPTDVIIKVVLIQIVWCLAIITVL